LKRVKYLSIVFVSFEVDVGLTNDIVDFHEVKFVHVVYGKFFKQVVDRVFGRYFEMCER